MKVQRCEIIPSLVREALVGDAETRSFPRSVRASRPN